VREESNEAEALEKQVQDSIRNDLGIGLLDITVIAIDDDVDETEDDGDEEKEDEDEDDLINVPKVAVWYRNAVMKKLWANASPSQKDAVEHYKEEDEETDEDPDDETGDGNGVQRKQVKRLQEVMRYVITWN
jgi:hypothetical protein